MSIERQFDINMEASYQSNEQYRATLRRMFFMDVSMCALTLESIDEETRDELTYDESTVSAVMDKLFDITKGHPLFQYLYDAGAAKMISTNREIGQAVLFSYDYLPLFHKCLASFIRNPEDFNESNEYYVSLSKKIV
jgi:hypothetical protein